MIRIGIISGAGLSHGDGFAGIINGVGPAAPPESARYGFDDARVTVVWDKEPEVARKLAAGYEIEHAAESLDEVGDMVDAVMALDDGTMESQRFALQFLERGMPTFIDKPLSPNPKEAAEIVALAERSKAPLMSCSALRFTREVAEARQKLDEMKPFLAACAVGPHDIIYYGIHPCELLQSAIGPGVVAVQNVGKEGRHIVRLFYDDERTAVLQVFEGIAYVFHLSVFGKGGWVSFPVTDGVYFYAETMRQFVQMCRTGVAAFPAGETLEIIRTLWCARKSAQESGRVVKLEEASR